MNFFFGIYQPNKLHFGCPICNYYTTAPLSFEVLQPNTRNKNWLLESYFYKPAISTPYTIFFLFVYTVLIFHYF